MNRSESNRRCERNAVTAQQIENREVLDKCVERIGSRELAVIIYAAAQGMGQRRDSEGIRAVARGHGAKERVCLAAFGFLRDGYSAGEYADAFAGRDCPTLDNRTDPQTTAAFALGRAIFYPGPLPGQLAHDPQQTSI